MFGPIATPRETTEEKMERLKHEIKYIKCRLMELPKPVPVFCSSYYKEFKSLKKQLRRKQYKLLKLKRKQKKEIEKLKKKMNCCG